MAKWTEEHSQMIAEMIETRDSLDMEEMKKLTGFGIYAVRNHVSILAYRLGVKIKWLHSAGKNILPIIRIKDEVGIDPSRVTKADKKFTEPKPKKEKFMCYCRTGGGRAWMVSFGYGNLDAVRMLRNNYPGIGEVLNVVNYKDYKRSSEGVPTGSSSVWGNSISHHVGKTRRVQ